MSIKWCSLACLTKVEALTLHRHCIKHTIEEDQPTWLSFEITLDSTSLWADLGPRPTINPYYICVYFILREGSVWVNLVWARANLWTFGETKAFDIQITVHTCSSGTVPVYSARWNHASTREWSLARTQGVCYRAHAVLPALNVRFQMHSANSRRHRLVEFTTDSAKNLRWQPCPGMCVYRYKDIVHNW